MPITFRHDAAAVVPPSNQTTRKYGQSLVLQQQQQKYNERQAGYDRLFTLGRDQQQSMAAAIRQGQQNAANTIRDVNQNVNLQARQDAQNKFLLEQQAAEQQNKFIEDARKQSSGMIMEDIKNQQYDPATARKLQQNLVAESEALGNPGLDATQRAEALAKIRAERTMLTANRMEKPPKAPPQPNFHTDPNGNQWVESGPGKWEQVPQQQKAPKSAQEYYSDPKNEDKFQRELTAKMQAMQDEQDLITDPAKKTPVTQESAWEQMQKDYEFRNKALGRDSTAPTSPAVPGGGASAPAAAQAPANPPTASSFNDQAEAARKELKEADDAINYDLDKETQRKNMDRRSKAIDNAMKFFPELKTEIDAVNALETGDLTPEEYNAGQDRFQSFFNSVIDGTFKPSNTTAAVPTKGQGKSPINQDIALAPGHPDYKPAPTPTGQRDEKGYVIMSDGSKVDPRDSAAMKSGGRQTQDVMRLQNPDGSPIEQSPNSFVEEMGSGRKQQVKVGGKPLAVTPGTLTPQETAARGQLMELPREQRIAALMPYEPSLKGKTLEQLLEDPKTKAGYEELSKQGLTTGNYREDMLGHIDEMLQSNVLNAGTKPDAYVGMNVNDIKDPKAKAEIEKLPRPTSKSDRDTIRSGQMYVDPEGVIRARA